jgi:outer membrane protein TolC
LHLTQENFEFGTALFLDILQTQDAVNQARLNYANAPSPPTTNPR